MIVLKFLSVNSRGIVTLREREPKTQANEVTIRLEMNIPNQFFTRPTIKAELKIPESAVPVVSITPVMATNLERIIKENLGLNMVVSIIDAPESK